MKEIIISSITPITISCAHFLDRFNWGRKEYAEKKSKKSPITIEAAIGRTRLIESRDENSAMLAFRVHYIDDDGIASVMDFPNFGLDISSKSTMIKDNDQIVIHIDFSIKAGKAKWQKEEIARYKKIFDHSTFGLELNLTLDEETDWGGSSISLQSAQDLSNNLHLAGLPRSLFKIEYK
jgi:hypothetical protein